MTCPKCGRGGLQVACTGQVVCLRCVETFDPWDAKFAAIEAEVWAGREREEDRMRADHNYSRKMAAMSLAESWATHKGPDGVKLDA